MKNQFTSGFRRTFWWAFSLLISFGISTSVFALDPGENLEVSVQRQNESQSELLIRLSNKGKSALNIKAGYVPWNGGATSGFQLFAVPIEGPDGFLTRAYSLRNPVGAVKLPPDQSVSGIIFLDREFPNLRAVRNKNDVAIFWIFSPVVNDDVHLDPQSGTIILKRLSQ